MIERFNFYDLYGYLIPGVVFLIIFWLPFGISAQGLNLDWLSAAVAVVFGYILGHVIQSMARDSFPSDQPRLPSDTLLDRDDKTFSPELKNELSFRVLRDFNIDVREDGKLGREIVARRRKDAFMLCRIRLLQNKKATYAEQFQGMYAMMRGITATCILGAAYYAGFFARALGVFNIVWYSAIMVAGITLVGILLVELGELGAIPKLIFWVKRPGMVFWLTALLSFSAPMVMSMAPGWLASPVTSFLIVFLLLFITAHCIRAYRFYAQQFAVTVYRDYCAA